MKTNDLRKTKAITLIALIVTIVVLLILAGVSIAVLTGENGILNRATSAKKTNEEKTAEEELRLGVSALTIDYRSNTTNAGSFKDYVMNNITALAKAMGVNANELSMDTDNYSVTYKGQTYTITDDGNLEPFVLVPLTAFNIVEETLEVAEGETKKLTIQKTPSNANERIVWTSSDDTIATVDANGNVTGVKNGVQTATISAVSKSGNVNSSTNCVVTVTKSLGYFKTENGVAKYYSSASDTIGIVITKENMGEYLGMRVNYIPDGRLTNLKNVIVGKSEIYRLFYIDIATDVHPNGNYYGDGLGTIYLKADYDFAGTSLDNLPPVASGDDLVTENYNKLWAVNSTYKNNPKKNMTYVKRLLDKNIWDMYKDDGTNSAGIASYVVGAPSLEMWVDSYNAFLASNPVTGKCTHNCTIVQDATNGPAGENNGYGYYIGYNGAYADNSGWYTGANTLVNPSSYQNGSNAAKRVYAWNSGDCNYWLASPSAYGEEYALSVNWNNFQIGLSDVDYNNWNTNYFGNPNSICPVVCCNFGVAILEAQ